MVTGETQVIAMNGKALVFTVINLQRTVIISVMCMPQISTVTPIPNLSLISTNQKKFLYTLNGQLIIPHKEMYTEFVGACL